MGKRKLFTTLFPVEILVVVINAPVATSPLWVCLHRASQLRSHTSRPADEKPAAHPKRRQRRCAQDAGPERSGAGEGVAAGPGSRGRCRGAGLAAPPHSLWRPRRAYTGTEPQTQPPLPTLGWERLEAMKSEYLTPASIRGRVLSVATFTSPYRDSFLAHHAAI